MSDLLPDEVLENEPEPKPKRKKQEDKVCIVIKNDRMASVHLDLGDGIISRFDCGDIVHVDYDTAQLLVERGMAILGNGAHD